MNNIVLFAPEIPQNTGAIARTCAATGSVLHLIRPLGFDISDAAVKRAGLDYWHMMHYTVYDDLKDFFARHPGISCYFASTKSEKRYCDVRYGPDDYIFFGKETKGLDENLLRAHYDRCVRIPMMPGARSLNLANSVAVVLYEALRQRSANG